MILGRRRFLTTLAAFGCAPALPLLAQSGGTPVAYPLFDAPPASHRLERFDLRVGELTYRLFLACPRGVAPAQGWPSIWMLDGNAAFARLDAARLAAHPGLAVVGLGYPVDAAFDSASRARDYTPEPLEEPLHGRGRDWQFGGQAAFRARLLGPLAKALAEHVPLDRSRRSLWGHSYGGLFVLATLFATPGAFRAYMPISPSVGFGGGALLGLEEVARRRLQGRAEVLMMLGDREHPRGTPEPTEPSPNPTTLALGARLARRGDLRLQLEVLEGLGHGATLSASFAQSFALAAA